jgi:membrane protein implicated in regulation of membrane protease activity
MEVWHILIIIGIIAFIAEIFTVGFISGSIGIGLIFAAIGNYFGLDTKWQILVFSFGVALAFFLIRPIVIKFGFRNQNQKTNQDALIDKKGIVIQEINANKNTGRVTIDGDDWKATTKNNDIIQIGTTIKVVAIDSIILTVKPLN